MAKKFRLRVEAANQPIQFFTVPLGRTIIGRDPSSDLVLYNDSVVSRTHAKLDFDGETCRLTHIGTTNQTILVGNDGIDIEIDTRSLQQGDVLQLGQHRIYVEASEVEQIETVGAAIQYETKPIFLPTAKHIRPYSGLIPPGLRQESLRLLELLPEIYQSEHPKLVNNQGQNSAIIRSEVPFLSRFLALFESVLLPLEWITDHFDFYLDQNTTPDEFLEWLENWYGLPFDASWTIEKRRALLAIAHEIYAKRGTRWALETVLSIYTDTKPTIDDQSELNVVRIQLPISEKTIQRKNLDQLVKHLIPAHANYKLTFLEITL